MSGTGFATRLVNTAKANLAKLNETNTDTQKRTRDDMDSGDAESSNPPVFKLDLLQLLGEQTTAQNERTNKLLEKHAEDIQILLAQHVSEQQSHTKHKSNIGEVC